MLSRRGILLSSMGLTALGGSCTTAPEAAPIRDALSRTVGARESLSGTVAVVIEGGASRLVAHGSTGVPGLALDARTVFEIGSITKVMTALLLADMAAQGEVGLDDAVGEYLPSAVTLHPRASTITLRDLANYNSGLPKFPANLQANWWANPNPFAAYTVDMLCEALSAFAPADEPGRPFVYSSFGFGVLGLALARRAGKSFEQLLIERVCDPLDLSHTRIALSPDMLRRMAQGRDLNARPASLWDFTAALEGAGAARANAADMTVFLGACMGRAPAPLRAAMARLLETRRPTTLAGTQAGLGWFISSNGEDEIAWKSGLTRGFNTFVGFSTRSRRGALVLSNFVWQPVDVGTTDMGLRMINPAFDAGDLSLLYQ